ncbi:MAG TPA: metal ABC transporter ATP-binding protein [Gemmataceae bacterium]|nr:metal ABC transporter ATP-binding protein [Gemmataceae bacterium]
MTHDLVTIHNLHVRLGGNDILRGVNAGLAEGRITALIGLNGSGKTTLLRALLQEVPYSGQIRFHCGHDHTRPTPEHVGYVPQKLYMDAKLPLTVRDLLALALQRRPIFLGISRRTRRQLEELLDRVWARHLLDQPVAGLSGGELQKVLLGLALHPRPELLLLDEPAAGIDFEHAEKFYDLIARLNRETGVTVLLVSHELSVVSKHAHHVLCLKDGRIQCQGPPQKILTSEVLAQTFGAEKDVYTHPHDRHPPPSPLPPAEGGDGER